LFKASNFGVHISGEALSIHHGWIVSALQSSSMAIQNLISTDDCVNFLFPHNLPEGTLINDPKPLPL
jgi:hypothetical protein